MKKQLELLLAGSPDPIQALSLTSQFIHRHPEEFRRISDSVQWLRCLVTTFGYSRFLSEALLRDPSWFLPAVERLAHALPEDELRERLLRELAADGDAESAPDPVIFARFRRHQILRILLRDVLRIATLSDVTSELSTLSDVIVDVALDALSREFERRHGTPHFTGPGNTLQPAHFAVLALGKLGGEELNYSSDIDLMFLYSGNGETDGPEPISTKEFFKKVANRLTELLSTYTSEGLCYRVDLRLRPEGTLGEVCISLEGAKAYYATRARDWELQMLIKARVSAGDRDLGRALLDDVEPRIYSSTLDFSAVEAVSATRQRIGEKLAARQARSPAQVDVKLSPGGIRDIEFLVQCLQRMHGGRERWVRHGGTLLALFRLRDKGFLSPNEYSRLASAYEFYRNLEHRLQFVDDRQTHTLPADRESLEVLARKMPHSPGETPGAESLEKRLRDYQADVRELYERVIYLQKPMYYQPVLVEPIETPGDEFGDESRLPASSNVTRFLDHRAPRLAAFLGQSRLLRGRNRFDHLLEGILHRPEWLARLDEDLDLSSAAVEIFEYSPFFADQCLRDPELLGEITRFGAAFPRDNPEDPVELRRFFRREMIRIQSESLCRSVPIFATLGKTSDLADRVIASAYQIAMWNRLGATPPASTAYIPHDQMQVIALGRLGVREFDVGSDADLVFVIPDEDASEHRFWTAVAESLIDIISAYTGEGVIFSVDTRLRPYGREGSLVQTVSKYKEYFSNHAEAWEGIAYMKARGVAGNIEHATRFLNEIQEADWRRWGQGGRSRQSLVEMRSRLEREQGQRNPLKAGRGGYYDIDFVLMFLRLKGAGIFFKVLNTPERIDVIEKMGHLDREDAEFLGDAATFYRALDHAMRVASGHTEGRLPVSQGQLEVLVELVRRWTPERLHGLPLNEQLYQIQTRTSEFFHRVFG
ncbi:MAG: glutamine-synthetase adenylyltransferase [Bryobacteraceae bacterium]